MEMHEYRANSRKEKILDSYITYHLDDSSERDNNGEAIPPQDLSRFHGDVNVARVLHIDPI